MADLLGSPRLQVRYFHLTGFWMELPHAANSQPGVGTVTARVTQTEGYADATVNLFGTESDFPGLARGQRIEIWLDWKTSAGTKASSLLYRGYIDRITPRNERGIRSLSVALFGLWSRAARTPTFKRFAFTQGAGDKKEIFDDLATTFVLPALAEAGFTATTVSPSYTGETLQSFDGWDSNFAGVLESLNLDPARFVYGIDADPTTLGHRLYLAPVQPDYLGHVLPLASPHGSAAEGSGAVAKVTVEDDAEPITHLRLITNTDFPNLLAEATDDNVSFERPELPELSTAGNLVPDPSFQFTSTPWSVYAGATIKNTNEEGIPAFEGDLYVELDNIGEGVSQTFTPLISIKPGEFYRITVKARLQTEGNLATAEQRLQWLDASGTAIGAEIVSSISPQSITWESFTRAYQAPAGAAKARIKYELTLQDVTDEDYAVLLDWVLFYEDVPVQKGWRLEAFGSAHLDAVNWTCTEGWHGAYYIRASVTASDADGQDVNVLATSNNGRFQVVGGQMIVGGFALRLGAGSDPVHCFLEVRQFDASGGEIGSGLRGYFDVTSDTDWGVFSMARSLANNAAQADLKLGIRSTGTLEIDGGFVFDKNVTLPTAESVDTFITGQKAECTYLAEQLFPTGPIHDAAIAIGPIWETLDRNDLTTESDREALARQVFTERLGGQPRVTVEILGVLETGASSTLFATTAGVGNSVEAHPGEILRLPGHANAMVAAGLPILERSFTWSGGKLSTVLTVGRTPRDIKSELPKAVTRLA